MFYGLFAALLFAGACSSGSDDPAPAPEAGLEISVEEISVAGDAAVESVTVTASGEWGVSSEDPSWCSVSPSGGIAGTSTIRVSMSENTTGEARTTNLVFRSGSSKLRSIPVTQHYRVVAVEIADPAFKAALLEAYDADGDGILSTKEAAAVTRIEVPGKGIRSMGELNAHFRSVTWLDCSDNALAELDVAELTRLTHLDCSGNQLSTLDIQNLQSLVEFDATGNPDLAEIYVWTGFSPREGFRKPDGTRYVEPEIATPAGYRLVWSDEFNEAGETLPDASKWWYETGDGGWGNSELQDYVSGSYGGEMLAKISGGTLKITAKEIGGKVRSIRMNTAEGWTYGYFEARLKLCTGKGTWPAFWMMPVNYTAWPGDGEIDIMEEVGYHPNYVSSSIHCNAYNHVKGTQKTNEIQIPTAQTEFHTYAVEWTEEYLRFLFDGQEHFRFSNDGKGNRDTWPFDAPFYLKLNLAWGGSWGGAMGVDASCLPAVYEVDYVRVFKKIE